MRAFTSEAAREGARPEEPTRPRPPLGAEQVLALQRTAGNAAVARALAPRELPGGAGTRPIPRTGAVPTHALGSGRALAAETRSPFEQAYGYRLDAVRVHTDSEAAGIARSLDAAAVTLGDHVLVDQRLNLESPGGQFVLGHELAHVVQSRLGSGADRAHDASEREATSASFSALGGRPSELSQRTGDEPQLFPWLLAGLLALSGLATGAMLAIDAAERGQSPDENRAKHVHDNRSTGERVLAWVPVAGSVQEIYQAESEFQRNLGVGFLAFDFATLGTSGVALALVEVGWDLLAVLARRVMTREAVEAGAEAAARGAAEQVTEAEAKAAAQRILTEGGGRVAGGTAKAEIARALSRPGSVVAAVEGGHSVIYANIAGQIAKLHGGPTRVRFATKMLGEATEETAGKVAARSVDGQRLVPGSGLSAYVIVEGLELSLETIERDFATGLAGGFEAIVRLLGGSPTSCGVFQGAAMEAAGLLPELATHLFPAGASGRFMPINIVGEWVESGAARIVEGGWARMVLGANGAFMQGALALLPIGVRGLPGAAAREALSEAAQPERAEEPEHSPVPEIDAELDQAAAAIVERYGTAPIDSQIVEITHDALPELITGWHVMNDRVARRLRRFLSARGMSQAAVDAIVPPAPG